MKKTKQILIWLITLFEVIITIQPKIANCQNIVGADPSDTFDLQSLFVNPAVVPFQPRQLIFGMKIYQLGFLNSNEFGIRNSYIGFTLPEAFSGLINFGLTGQNFSTPLYDQTNFSFQIARQSFERVFVGFKYNLFTKSYHQKYFDLVDPDDPVFANGTLKLAHSIGLGMILFPWSHLAIGFSCDHINRPDVALTRDHYRQPVTYDFGARYSYRYFSSSIYFNYLQKYWQFNWILESRPIASTIFKVGYVQNAAKFEAQFYVFNGFSINYIFDYPFYDVNQFSSGSHQISLLSEFKNLDKVRELQFTRHNEGKVPIFNLPAQFSVEMAADNLEIVSQKLVHSIDDRIPEPALINLTEAELVLHDSSGDLQQLQQQGNATRGSLSRFYSSPKYSKKYQQFLNNVAHDLSQPQAYSLNLITDFYSMQRALNLRDSMAVQFPSLNQHIQIKNLDSNLVTKNIYADMLKRLPQQETVHLNPQTAIFKISSMKMRNYHHTWELIISDYSGRMVKSFSGKNQAPEEITWDWRDKDGNLIKPDIYFYHIQWKDKKNQVVPSQRKIFYVKKISRTVKVDLRLHPDPNQKHGEAIEIKMIN